MEEIVVGINSTQIVHGKEWRLTRYEWDELTGIATCWYRNRLTGDKAIIERIQRRYHLSPSQRRLHDAEVKREQERDERRYQRTQSQRVAQERQ